MNKWFNKLGLLLGKGCTFMALFMTTMIMDNTCRFVFYQPEVPEEIRVMSKRG